MKQAMYNLLFDAMALLLIILFILLLRHFGLLTTEKAHEILPTIVSNHLTKNKK